MHATYITNLALGFVAVWLTVVLLHALFEARKPQFDPLPPEMPEHHGDHGHGRHGHDDAHHH